MIQFFTAIIFIFAIAGNAVAGIDFQCANDCSALGHDRQYCVSQCSYNDNTMQPQPAQPVPQMPNAQQTDSQCLNKCTQEGSPYPLCQKRCSH